MDKLKRKVGLHQGIFFLAVVGLLFMPYALLTLEMTWSQLKALLIFYAWEAPLFAIICIALPMRWVGALQQAHETAAKKALETPTEMYTVISRGLRLPLKIAWSSLIFVLIGFVIGILQLIIFAGFDGVQSMETLMIGIMIAMIYAACCFFSNERILAPHLGAWVEEFGMTSPPRVLTLFNKILVVCLSIMVVTVLFQGSVTFSHSNRLVEDLRGKNSLKELRQLKPIIQKLKDEGQEKEIETILSNVSEPMDLDFFILHKSGETPAGKEGNLMTQQNAGNLKSVFLNLRNKLDPQDSYSSHKDVEGQKLYYALPLKSNDLLLVKVIAFETLRKEMTSLLLSILISSVVVLFIAFYLSYRLAQNASAPLKKLEEVADRIADGDISCPVNVITGDEIGALSCSFLRMQQELSKLSQQANNIACGDLTSQVEFKGDLGKAFNQMQTDLSEIIVQVREAILKISTACNQILASSEEQASGASEQAASVGETTASIEELSATAGQIAENSDIQAGMAESTQQNAEESASAMDEAAALMEDIRHHTEKGAEQIMSLGEKSQQIGKVL
ncbi:MAG TPA: HAMP domain-containing protein, partial [Desulfobacteria bacterium]|nr:HAMP domain-containing protein [Desulfobacteria bacterium]